MRHAKIGYALIQILLIFEMTKQSYQCNYMQGYFINFSSSYKLLKSYVQSAINLWYQATKKDLKRSKKSIKLIIKMSTIRT